MYIIGLTGNIATGKSTVARLLHELGAEVLDADILAHETMRPGTAVWDEIRRRFGPAVIAPDGAIDRRRLGEIVFADPGALADLEGITHPAVAALIDERLRGLRSRRPTPAVVVIEAIKLLEAGLGALCDAIWVVTAPRALQIKRLVQTRRMTPEEAALRIDAQPPAELKIAQAQVVIVNDGSPGDLARQVQAAWAQIPLAKEGEKP